MNPVDSYKKYGAIDKAWRLSQSPLTREEFRKALNIGEYRTKFKVGPDTDVIPSAGSTKDGRYRVAHFTDLHSGSIHFHQRGLERFLEQAYDEGCRVACCSGDVVDGNRPVLLYDQVTNRLDKQLEILSKTKIPPFEDIFFIAGNHDGYHAESAGIITGKLLAAELGWKYLGACLGYVYIHNAKWQLWHPGGSGGSKNGIRTIIYNRFEHYESDVLALGHYHRFSVVLDAEENRFGFSGGTFQLKASEFANRITQPWDLGGTIVSYTLENGVPMEYSARFIPIDGK